MSPTKMSKSVDEGFADAIVTAGIDPNDIGSLLDLDAEPWGTAENPPPEGSKLVGWVVAKTTRDDSPFGPYPIVTVLTEDGKLVSLHAFHRITRDLAGAAQQGDRIGVKFKGRKPSAVSGQSDYYNYSVILQRRHALDAGVADAPALTE